MIYFILGMLFVNSIFPLLDGITSLCLTMIELAKAYLSTKIAACNATIKDIANKEDRKPTIGFSIEEEYEDE